MLILTDVPNVLIEVESSIIYDVRSISSFMMVFTAGVFHDRLAIFFVFRIYHYIFYFVGT